MIGAIVAFLVLVVPFLVPVSPAPGVADARELALTNSRFLSLEDLDIHYTDQGKGDIVFVLFHGFGAWLTSWDDIVPELSRLGRVVAWDRPAFGLTSRPASWAGANPYALQTQVEITREILDALGIDKAVLIGHSAGGLSAWLFAQAYPERVEALVLENAALLGGGPPPAARFFLRIPSLNHLGPLLARQIGAGTNILLSAYSDPAVLDDARLSKYQLPTRVAGWDTALWQFTRANSLSRPPLISWDLNLPVLVIGSDQDRILPTTVSPAIHSRIPGSRITIISNCGHIPHEEAPQAFLTVLRDFLGL